MLVFPQKFRSIDQLYGNLEATARIPTAQLPPRQPLHHNLPLAAYHLVGVAHVPAPSSSNERNPTQVGTLQKTPRLPRGYSILCFITRRRPRDLDPPPRATPKLGRRTATENKTTQTPHQHRLLLLNLLDITLLFFIPHQTTHSCQILTISPPIPLRGPKTRRLSILIPFLGHPNPAN